MNGNNNDKKNSNTPGLAIGICLGIAICSAVGALTHNVGLWLPIGLSIGLVLGFAMGKKAIMMTKTKRTVRNRLTNSV